MKLLHQIKELEILVISQIYMMKKVKLLKKIKKENII